MAKFRKIGDIFTPEHILYYREHIHEFIEDVIFQRPDDPDREEYLIKRYRDSHQQRELMEALQASTMGGKRRIAARSGKGIGKTSGLSWGIFWFMTCFDKPNIFCTSKSFPTLKSGLWKEIAVWREGSPILSDIYEQLERRMYLRESPQTWFCEIRTARDKESMQGLHAPNMLIVVDEASGIEQDIFETVDTTLKDGQNENNVLVMIGNPTQISGPFYEAFTKFGKRWSLHHFSGEEAPKEARDDEQIEYYREKYGREHNLYKVSVRGEFPDGNVDSFLTLAEVEAAVNREGVLRSGPIELGVDVARQGDDLTVIYWRWGYYVFDCEFLAKSTIPEVEQLVLGVVRTARAMTGSKDRIRVKVDDTGLAGLADYLKLNRTDNIEVIPINFASGGNERYHNTPSIMWGNIKDNIDKISLPDDTLLVEELATRRSKITTSNKIMIEPKSEFKKEYGSSPDRADALILCFAEPKPEKLVLNGFDACDKSFVRGEVSFVGQSRYCAMHYSDDLYVSIVYAAWDGYNLTVIDEYVGDASTVEIAMGIMSHGDLNAIYGNDLMFGNIGSDLESEFRKYNVRIQENYQYDLLGSMELLSNMVSQRRLSVYSGCKQTVEQLSGWNTSESKRKTERKYGLCYALTNLASAVKNNSQKINLLELNNHIDNQQLKGVKNRWQLY